MIAAIWRAFCRSRGGNLAIGFAVAAPMLIGLTGGAIDLGSFIVHKRELQGAADAAALAAAKEGGLSGWSQTSAQSVVESYLDANLRRAVSGDFTAHVKVDVALKQVTVDLDADSDVKPAGIPINYRPPFRFEAGHDSNQLPASSRL